jgi:ABC-type hemin transport system substrate-binding protein
MVESLSQLSNEAKIKDQLKAQSAYFNIIDPKYFSDQLSAEWTDMVRFIKKQGTALNEEGKTVLNAVNNTINEMSDEECKKFILRIYDFYDKLKVEFA